MNLKSIIRSNARKPNSWPKRTKNSSLGRPVAPLTVQVRMQRLKSFKRKYKGLRV
jgi:hypothetical protein